MQKAVENIVFIGIEKGYFQAEKKRGTYYKTYKCFEKWC